MNMTNVQIKMGREELFFYESAKDLMNNKEFYILLERFCNKISKTNSQYNNFLNHYFNDEGYVDIWRIPHVIADIANNRVDSNKVIGCEEFRTTFSSFLSEFYNFITFSGVMKNIENVKQGVLK